MKLKDNTVKLEGMDWRLWQAAVTCEAILAQYGSDMVITSAKDGKHHDGSLHYVGRAIDIRIWKIANRAQQVIAEMKAQLGPEYDVVLEEDHIHLEYDPS